MGLQLLLGDCLKKIMVMPLQLSHVPLFGVTGHEILTKKRVVLTVCKAREKSRPVRGLLSDQTFYQSLLSVTDGPRLAGHRSLLNLSATL